VNATIEGVVRMPSLFSITLALLPSITATQGIGRAEIDTDDLAHVHLVVKQDRAARGSTVPIPREVITAIP